MDKKWIHLTQNGDQVAVETESFSRRLSVKAGIGGFMSQQSHGGRFWNAFVIIHIACSIHLWMLCYFIGTDPQKFEEKTTTSDQEQSAPKLNELGFQFSLLFPQKPVLLPKSQKLVKVRFSSIWVKTTNIKFSMRNTHLFQTFAVSIMWLLIKDFYIVINRVRESWDSNLKNM